MLKIEMEYTWSSIHDQTKKFTDTEIIYSPTPVSFTALKRIVCRDNAGPCVLIHDVSIVSVKNY